MSKVAVLSRHKEGDTYWYNTLINHGYEVIVFNKHNGDNLLPNIGREGHTYLYYITQNYDNLPDEILFSQYDPRDHFQDANKEQKHNSEQYFLKSCLYDFIGIRPGQFPYICGGKHVIKWIDTCNKLFESPLDNHDINRMISTGATLNGVFRVSKDAILSHDIMFYKRCLEILSHSIHPIEGYFFERIWRFLFTNYGAIDNIKYKQYIDMPLLYKHYTHKSFVFNNAFGHIKLYNDGTISSNDICYYKHRNERFWKLSNDNILIFDYCGGLTNKIFLKDSMPMNLDTYNLDMLIWKKNNGSINALFNFQ